MNIKKFIIFLSFSLVFLGTIANGQSVVDPINSIGLSFCNDGTEPEKLTKVSDIFINPGGEKDLCLYFYNEGEKEISFSYGFSEGSLGSQGESHCSADDSETNQFSMLIPKTSERVITLAPQSYESVMEKVKVPLGIEGAKLGCISFKTTNTNAADPAGGIFNIVFRRATPIKILVAGEGSINNSIKLNKLDSSIFSSNKKIKVELGDDDNLKLGLSIENDGNIDQKITINGKVYNALGYEKEFSINENTVIPSEVKELSIDVGKIPSYKGPLSVELFLKSTTSSSFDIPAERKTTQEINETGTIFIFSWIWVGVLALLLLILFLIFKPLFKKHKVTA